MLTSVELDDALIEEALQLTQAKTEQELIHLAITELIRARKKKNLLELAGQLQLREGYDHKALRATRNAAD